MRWSGRRKVGQRYRVERVGDRVAHLDPQHVHVAETGPAADAGVSRILGGADHRHNRTFERANNSTHPYFCRRRSERVPAMRTARTLDEPGLAQADDELLQIGPRQRLVIGHLSQADRSRAVVPGQLHHQPHAVLATCREVDGAAAREYGAPRGRLQRWRRVEHRQVVGRRIPSNHVRIKSRPRAPRPQSKRPTGWPVAVVPSAPMEFKEVIRRRRTVRNYDPAKAVSRDAVERIVEAAQRAPSAGFSQGQRLVVVTDGETRRAIAEICDEPEYVAAGFDPWGSRAPVLLISCVSEGGYHPRYREADKLEDDGTEIEWPVPYWWVDIGTTWMLIMLAAVDEGLAAGFLGTHRIEELKTLLGVPAEFVPIGVVTVGHPLPDRKSGSLKRGWVPNADFARWEKW